MVTSSLTHRYNEEIYRTLSDSGVIDGKHDRIDEWSDVPEEIADHVVIVGYGRQGTKLVETCEELDQPYVVIENDPARRDAVTSECEAAVVGDAMETYTWEKANVADATLVLDGRLPGCLASYSLARFLGRRDAASGDQETALELLDEGALYVSHPDLLAGQQLVQQIEELLDGDLSRDELRELQQAEIERRADYAPLHFG